MSVGGAVVVRDATVDDVPAVVGLLNQLSLAGEVREAADVGAYVCAFNDIVAAGHAVVVVEEAGVVVACATMMVLPNLSHGGRPVAQLESVVVDVAVRGRGVGAVLVDACLARARDAGCFRAQLTSNHARGDAHRFWAARGFVASHQGFKRPL